MADSPFPPQGRYQIDSHLGEGSVSDVYRAYDTRLHRYVALKRLNAGHPEFDPAGAAEAHAQAWREAVHLAAIQHPNVITVHDCDTDERGTFLVMELVPGETLEAVVGRGALPLEDFLTVAAQSLEGLAAAHQIGLYHCDLKPANLMLKYNASGHLHVKLVDFGIAGFSIDLNAPPHEVSHEESRTILGTVEFMAPERFENQPVNARTEIYSMGCIFYYALTGVDPFGGRTVQEVVASHLNSLVLPLQELRSDLPNLLCDWIMRLISRDPAQRPASAVETLVELHALRVEIVNASLAHR